MRLNFLGGILQRISITRFFGFGRQQAIYIYRYSLE